MHTHTHIHKRDGSSQKSLFPDTRSSIVHTLRVVVGGGAGELWGRRLLGGVQRRRRTFVHAQSLSAVTRSFVFQGVGAAGFGKKKKKNWGGEDTLVTGFSAQLLHSPRTLFLYMENNLPDRPWPSRRDRAPRSFFYKHPGRPAEAAALCARSKERSLDKRGAAQVFGVAVR